MRDLGIVGPPRGDGIEKVREEGLSPRHRGGSEVRRRRPGSPLQAQERARRACVPPLPAALRPQSPMAAAALRNLRQVNARPPALTALTVRDTKAPSAGRLLTCPQARLRCPGWWWGVGKGDGRRDTW